MSREPQALPRTWVTAYPDSGCADRGRPVIPQTRVTVHPASDVAQLQPSPAGTRIAISPRMPTHPHLVHDDAMRATACAELGEDRNHRGYGLAVAGRTRLAEVA